jgi:hypothetical protein
MKHRDAQAHGSLSSLNDSASRRHAVNFLTVYGRLRAHPSKHALKFRCKMFLLALILVCVSVGRLVLQAERDAMQLL